MRETLFSAIRSLVEAMTAEQPPGAGLRGHPLGRRGDARPDRAPGALGAGAAADRLPRPRRAARPPLRLGRRAAQRDLDRPRPLSRAETQELVEALYNGATATATRRWSRASPSGRAATRCSRRRSSTACKEEGARRGRAARRRFTRCSPPASTRCAPFERRLLQYASVVGQNFWEGVLRRAAGESPADVGEALDSLQEKELVIAARRSRLAGEREYAFKHALIRDVAYGMLPKASRCRQHFAVGELHRGARRRGPRGRGGAGRRALRPRGQRSAPRRGSSRTSCGDDASRRCEFLEAAGRRGRLASTPTRRRSATTGPRAASTGPSTR